MKKKYIQEGRVRKGVIKEPPSEKRPTPPKPYPFSMSCQCTKTHCSICKKEGEKKMAFKKTGIAPIEDIYCSCGGKVNKETKKCDKCGKEFVAKD